MTLHGIGLPGDLVEAQMFANKKRVAAVVVLIGAMFAGLFYISLPYIDPGYSAKKAGEYLVSKGVVEGPVVVDQQIAQSYHAQAVVTLPKACLTIVEYNRHDSLTKRLHSDLGVGSDVFSSYNDNLFLISQRGDGTDSETCNRYWVNGAVPLSRMKKIIQEFENYDGHR